MGTYVMYLGETAWSRCRVYGDRSPLLVVSGEDSGAFVGERVLVCADDMSAEAAEEFTASLLESVRWWREAVLARAWVPASGYPPAGRVPETGGDAGSCGCVG